MSLSAFTPRPGPALRREATATIIPFPRPAEADERRALAVLRDLRAALRQRDSYSAQGRHGMAWRASLGLPFPEVRRALAALPYKAAVRSYCEAFPEVCERDAATAARRLRRAA